MHSAHTSSLRAKLIDLPNVSFALAEKLVKIGVATPAHLRGLGAETSWARLRQAGLQDSIQSLLALEGAILGLPWQSLPHGRRRELVHYAANGA